MRTGCSRFPRPRQFSLELRDQFAHWFAKSAPAMVENGMPISERIFVHRASPPASYAGDGRDEVGADASFYFHELRIPMTFLDSRVAFVFLGCFAFGLRASLLDRFCPLAISRLFVRLMG